MAARLILWPRPKAWPARLSKAGSGSKTSTCTSFPMPCRWRSCRRLICSFAPAAKSGCPIFFCGSWPTPSCTLPMCCGRTSMPAILARRSRTLPPANGASAAWPESSKVLEQRIATAVVLAAAGLLAAFFLPPLWFAAAAAGLLLVAGGWRGARLARLTQRVATAVVLAAAGLLAVFFLPPLWFAAAAAGLLLVAGGWEAARLAGLTNPALRWLYGLVLAAAGAAMHLSSMPAVPFLAAACVLWLLGFVWLGRASAQKPVRPTAAALKLVVTGWLLLAAWLGLCLVQARSPWLVVLLLVIIAAADTCAYFSGRHFGGPKLAPAISPGKPVQARPAD